MLRIWEIDGMRAKVDTEARSCVCLAAFYITMDLAFWQTTFANTRSECMPLNR